MTVPLTHLGSRNNLLGENADTTSIVRFSNELQVTQNTPPTFLVHSAMIALFLLTTAFITLLHCKIIKYEVKCILPERWHGYGLAETGKQKNSGLMHALNG